MGSGKVHNLFPKFPYGTMSILDQASTVARMSARNLQPGLTKGIRQAISGVVHAALDL